MRALFVGEAGPVPARILAAWLESGHEVAAYWRTSPSNLRYWRRDAILGIWRPEWSVSRLLSRHRIGVVRAWESDWNERIEAAKSLNADVLISAVGFMIFSQPFLDLYGRRAVNFHPALLPAYRGPSPRLAQIIDETFYRFGGMTMHALTRGIDEGAIIGQRKVQLDIDKGYWHWDLALAEAAADLVRVALPEYLSGALDGSAQPVEMASYRRVGRPDWTIFPETTVDRVRLICATIGAFSKIDLRIQDRHYCIHRLKRILGPPTGEPPEIGRRTIALDVRDGRIVLTRWRRTSSAWNEIARHRAVLEATRKT